MSYLGANDIIVVKQTDESLCATPLHVRVGKFDSFKTFFYSREGKIAHVSVNDVAINLTEPEIPLNATDKGMLDLLEMDLHFFQRQKSTR